MKYLSLCIGIAAISFITACGSNSNGETIYIPKNDSTAVNSVTIPDTNGTVPKNTITAPGIIPVSTSSTTQTPVQTNSAVSAAGLNPEHGKPGHRCDIAVGAPLNSPVQPSATPTITTSKPAISQQPATIISNPQPTKEIAAGMNPEHGKPGHRCDIAVGAPLDSKPAEVKTVQQPATTNPGAPVTPLLPASTTPAAPVTAGMNPEHGKPGHRCDIAVGAPLPKQ